MTRIVTNSLIDLRRRSRTALEQGSEYVYEAPNRERLKVMYAASGGIIYLEHRANDGGLVDSMSYNSAERETALRAFAEQAQRMYARTRPAVVISGLQEGLRQGVEACITTVSAHIPALPLEPGTVPEVRMARNIRESLYRMLERIEE